jgi:hypothetical protein
MKKIKYAATISRWARQQVSHYCSSTLSICHHDGIENKDGQLLTKAAKPYYTAKPPY